MLNKKKITFFVIFVLSLLILVIPLLLSKYADKKEDLPTYQKETEQPSVHGKLLNGIVVGQTKLQDVELRFGKIIESETLGDGNRLSEVKWKSSVYPLVVGTDSQDTVVYLQIDQALVDEVATLDGLKKQYSLQEPDLVLYVPTDNFGRVNVYLNEGLAIYHLYESKEVLVVMYFTPVDKDSFLKTWGSKFSTKPVEPGN